MHRRSKRNRPLSLVKGDGGDGAEAESLRDVHILESGESTESDPSLRPIEEIGTALRTRYDFRFNTLLQLPEFRDRSAKEPRWERQRDDKQFCIYSYARRLATGRDDNLANQRDVRQAIINETRQNDFDPVSTYLHACADRFGEKIAKAEKTDKLYSPIDSFLRHFKVTAGGDHGNVEFILKWMLGCVARAMDGYQNHTLVFSGKQGLGKSFLARWLCSGFGDDANAVFQEGEIEPRNKDHVLRLGMKWIWCADEFLSTMGRADQSALKAFLTMESINERPPYREHAVELRRQCNVIATVNEDQFLMDATGNRRYLVVSLEDIDHDYAQAVNIDDLWGHVTYLYLLQGSENYAHLPFKPELSKEEKRAQERSNEQAFASDPIEHEITALVRFTGEVHHNVYAHELFAVIKSLGRGEAGKAVDLRDRALEMKVASILKKMGARKLRVMIGHERHWVYRGVVWHANKRPLTT